MTKPAPNYYEWRETYPFLSPLVAAVPAILKELTAATRWFDWPETNLYSPDEGMSWRVYPFLHTFPATSPASSVWIEESVKACPTTAKLLQSLPHIRTALFSRMGPGTVLSTHTGWADLSNHVLRCHLALHVPDEEMQPCGLIVDGEVRYHRAGEVIIFDDSKEHSAFNHHDSKWRYVLIFDLMRPPTLPPGTATGATTEELQSFIDYFK
jgi:hypothetical protein